ncbi:hypothetical protein Tco_1365635 [Tanacetum coccineum]
MPKGVQNCGSKFVDHALSHSLTMTSDVLAVYLQQFWKTNFDSIPQRLEEDYHSIKDDIPLVSVYTIGDVLLKGMLIHVEFWAVNLGEISARSRRDLRSRPENKSRIKISQQDILRDIS